MIYISPGYEEVSGRTRQSLYEKPRSWVEVIHPDDRDRMIETVEQYRRGVFTEAEFRLVRPDGSVRWMRSRAFPIKDPVGHLSSFAGLAEDITERKHAEETLRTSEQRFQTFVDHATDAFFLQDDSGVILDVNRQACESLGYTREELVGKTPADFDPDVTPARIEELERRLNANEMVAFESRHRRKDGTLFPVDVRGRVFWEGGRRFLVSLARDISKRKQDEALLDGQKRILELIIQGEPLPHVLTVLCRTIEDLAQGEMLASVLLLDPDGVHLRHGAAPSLPEELHPGRRRHRHRSLGGIVRHGRVPARTGLRLGHRQRSPMGAVRRAGAVPRPARLLVVAHSLQHRRGARHVCHVLPAAPVPHARMTCAPWTS